MLLRTLCSRAVRRPTLRSLIGQQPRLPAAAATAGIGHRQIGSTTPALTTTTPAKTAVSKKRLSTQLLDPAAELDEFMTVFPDVVNSVTAAVQRYELPATTQASSWLAQAMLYNVPKGKRNRGLLTVSTFKLLQAQQLPAADEASASVDILRAQHLGWCVEMLQALFLVADDIMDHSETRRGAPCWYKVPAVGLTAVNDALMIENVIYVLLRQHFATTDYYTSLVELFHEAMLVTCIGESLDLQTAQWSVADFTVRQYTAIVHNKTSFYSFYLPVCAAMLMAGHRPQRDAALFAQVREILYEIGHFFQVQDDYLDCFGDPAVTGKIGTDIQDKKCSWLAVQCLARADPAQRALLESNYGVQTADAAVNAAAEAVVRGLYEQMGLRELYGQYEERSFEEISTRIQRLPDTIPRVIFEQIMEVIYRRKH